MSQIKVKNFGTIKLGFAENNGFIDIRKITVFIGNQGTGKSTIAKLISTLRWLEKGLYLEILQAKDIINDNSFVNKYCYYHNIKNYFLPETEIEYVGNTCNFIFRDGKLNIDYNKNQNYIIPKIMYIPAERNFFSAIRQPEKVQGLPQYLYTFWEELEKSKQELSEQISLPIGDVKLKFDEFTNSLNIIGNDYKLKLSEASSGFQSFIPLFLVARNIALLIQNKDKVKITNKCFFNIVEELEQNLSPQSQKYLFYKLLEFANMTEGNSLIITTHSPYLINYLALAIKGYEVLQEILSSSNVNLLKQQLQEIVPEVSCISGDNAIVYELTEQGDIRRLTTHDGLPSDENYLNISLAQTNDLFADLLEIEEQLDNKRVCNRKDIINT